MGLLQSLIEQSRLPSGTLGRIMLRIMNKAHHSLTLWGLSKLMSGDNILDVSCGGGNAVWTMAQTGKYKHIFGIDYSTDALSIAASKNKKYIESGLVTIMQASVLDLPFEAEYFDAITTFQSHYHWPDVLKAMHEIYRILKPGGQFVLAAENYKIEYHMKEYNNAHQTKVLFQKSGFKNIDLQLNDKCICVTGWK